MGRPSNTDARRTQITQGFMKVLSAKGYDKTSMPEVAAAAQLSQGLIHYHFKNKLQILLAVLEGNLSSSTAEVERGFIINLP